MNLFWFGLTCLRESFVKELHQPRALFWRRKAIANRLCRCLSNCKKHALSVISSVISAECLSCDEGETLNYQWTMQDYIDPQNPRSLPPEDLIGLATDGDVTSDIISLIPAGNSLLERVLQLCVEGTSFIPHSSHVR